MAGASHVARAWTAPGRASAVAAAGALAMAATVAYGLIATAGGADLGTPLPPFLFEWEPRAGAYALLATAVLAAGVAGAPRLLGLSPSRFAVATLGLGLATRLALGAARDGIEGWYAVWQLPNFGAASEYLPALPAFDIGTRFFLDTFAEVGTALPVHSVGHPPGLLTTLHLLGISSAEGLAALTIAVGALSIPLAYLAARELLDERRARMATLLYVFAPSATLYGAASADALYATLALVACAALLARSALARGLGTGALALASFFSYANLAIGAFAAAVTWRRDGLRSAVILAGACAIALAVFYGLLHVTTGFDPIGAVRSAESVYREGIASTRPYAFWLFGSPVAFLAAAGLPIAWFALRSLGTGETVALALFGVLAVAAVLGFSKAETERIYLFLVPLLCMAAAAALPPKRLPLVLGALAAQALATELLFFTIW